LRAAPVRYVSVRTGLGPRTGAEKATDGAMGAVTLTAPHFPACKPRTALSTASDHVLASGIQRERLI
jgi:hypothetical protein